MHVKSIPMWVGSSNNYAYLVIDDKSDKPQDAVIIDAAHPEEVTPVLKKLIDAGDIKLKAIVNTHHHWDHSGGNDKLRVDLGQKDLEIKGGKDCQSVTTSPAHGDTFTIGSAIRVTALHTPCHTQDSICWFMEDGSDKVVFTGDTLFHGGCGKFFEKKDDSGREMHKALNQTLASLPDDTRVFPGHEYTKSNCKFAAHVLPNDSAVKGLLKFSEENKETQGQFTIGDEKKHNLFMRPEDPEIQRITGKSVAAEVVQKLRDMKDSFK